MSSQPASASPSEPSTTRKRNFSSTESAQSTELYKSSTIEDRSSTFQAVFSPTAANRSLQAIPEFKSASHRILAWRRRTSKSQQTLTGPPREVFDFGHDDDGERYAGKRVERVLEELKVDGAVVVARWYGGVLLGPVRFTHIEDCAREAIAEWRASVNPDGPEASAAKKRKIQLAALAEKARASDTRSKDELIEILAARDQSVRILRALLAEKQGKAATKPASATPTYADMTIDALRRLEKARDTTLSWILKEIDKAEQGSKT